MEKIKTSDGRILTERQLHQLHINGFDNERIETMTYKEVSEQIGKIMDRYKAENLSKRDYYDELRDEMGFDVMDYI